MKVVSPTPDKPAAKLSAISAGSQSVGAHWPSAANLTVLTGSDHGAKRGIQPPSLDIKPK